MTYISDTFIKRLKAMGGADWNTNVSNKPIIPAAQVQSDWNAVTGMGQILNKPAITAPPSALSELTEDASHRLVTDTEKSTWNGKGNLALGDLADNAYPGDKGKAAYDHSQVAHVPTSRTINTKALSGSIVLTPDDLDDAATTHKFATGSNTGDETAARIATINHATSEKTTLVDADEISGQNSAATFGLIRTTWTNVKVFLKTYFDGLYNPKRLYTNLGASVVTSGTTEKVLIQLAIPANRAVVGSSFRATVIGVSSSTGTLIFKVRAGSLGSISDAVAWTAITSAAQVANKRAGFDMILTVRSVTTAYTDGVAYAGTLQLETVVGAAATSVIAISGIWYINLTVICSSGIFTAQVGNIEEIK